MLIIIFGSLTTHAYSLASLHDKISGNPDQFFDKQDDVAQQNSFQSLILDA